MHPEEQLLTVCVGCDVAKTLLERNQSKAFGELWRVNVDIDTPTQLLMQVNRHVAAFADLNKMERDELASGLDIIAGAIQTQMQCDFRFTYANGALGHVHVHVSPSSATIDADAVRGLYDSLSDREIRGPSPIVRAVVSFFDAWNVLSPYTYLPGSSGPVRGEIYALAFCSLALILLLVVTQIQVPVVVTVLLVALVMYRSLDIVVVQMQPLLDRRKGLVVSLQRRFVLLFVNLAEVVLLGAICYAMLGVANPIISAFNMVTLASPVDATLPIVAVAGMAMRLVSLLLLSVALAVLAGAVSTRLRD